MWVTAIPAYGRDYKSQKQVREDWKSGKDFQDARSGQYLNVEDAKRLGLKVIVRYDNHRKVVNV